MAQSDENGFVTRGLYLLGGMTLLAAVVLSIIFYRPSAGPTVEPKNLPARASDDGWKIRYNAAIALLRRGSDDVPWRTVREMLDENQQLKNCETDLPDGRKDYDPFLARSFVIASLKAVGEWHRKRVELGKPTDAFPAISDLRDQIELLAKSSVPELKIQAEKTRQAFAK